METHTNLDPPERCRDYQGSLLGLQNVWTSDSNLSRQFKELGMPVVEGDVSRTHASGGILTEDWIWGSANATSEIHAQANDLQDAKATSSGRIVWSTVTGLWKLDYAESIEHSHPLEGTGYGVLADPTLWASTGVSQWAGETIVYSGMNFSAKIDFEEGFDC